MSDSVIFCEKCSHWDGKACVDGHETAPAYFQFCFLTEGNVPEKPCPGPFPLKNE